MDMSLKTVRGGSKFVPFLVFKVRQNKTLICRSCCGSRSPKRFGEQLGVFEDRAV